MATPVFEPVPVSGIDQIDLDSHAVIEASAGTGKTYTIENLVVELLKSGRILNLEEILVVTFTEKAAGELKTRIREKIKKELNVHDSENLRSSLDNFDAASIYTIHGFCNTILQEYAFENAEQFQSHLTDDRTVFEQSLYHIMRNVWPERYGVYLLKVLKLSGYPGTTANGNSSWIDRVLDVALRYQPFGNDTIIPDGISDLAEVINEAERECQIHLGRLEKLIGPIDSNDIRKSDFPSRYVTLNISKNSMGRRLRIIDAILQLVADRATRDIDLNDLGSLFSSLDLDESGFHVLNSNWKKEGPDYHEKLPELPEIIHVLEDVRALDIRKIQNMLTAATVHDVKQHASEYKKTRGLISYDDMVTRVYNALSAKTSMLKNVLQRKYRYALVDEFQDTDMLQWKIFSTIFLESESNRLFIIGDPKQSIYGFRGADVHAYYVARNEMIRAHHAHYYSLNENWRSSRDLIASFNSLFGRTEWFSDSNIHYLPSHYPSLQDPKKHDDNTSMIVMDCGICSGSTAKYKSARFIAYELKRIIAENPDINLNDIAVLVTKWREAEAIEKFLKLQKISYSLYKKDGLYQSKEVLELLLVLTALANPHDLMARKKALITRFFRVPVNQLYDYTATTHGQPADLLFDRWITYASQKKWPLLFQSIMEDSGILFCTELEDHDRSLINYRSIMQNLEIEAYRNDFCIQDIIDYINSLRYRIASSHESYNIQTIDLDKPGVQILTIHASKGLQFKTVFLAGGFTKKTTAEFWTYHDSINRVFDLIRDPVNKALYDLEIDSEEERLFYVALTRARDRLYIPVFEPGSRSKSTAGIVGTKLKSALEHLRNDRHVTWLDAENLTDSESSVKKATIQPPGDIILPDPLLPEISPDFLIRTISIDSFSGIKNRLHTSVSHEIDRYHFGDPDIQPQDDDEQFSSSGSATTSTDSTHVLPRSKETGIALHTILEHIDFQTAGNVPSPSDLIVSGTASASIIDRAIRNHLTIHADIDFESTQEEIARIIWNTLNAPLNGSDLYLKHLDKKTHEVEFYFPSIKAFSLPVPEARYRQGFIHGFIDMIFLFQGKYYIIDWKSNFIEEGYSREHIEQNIFAMHYDLQMKIYFLAVIRWLQQIIPDYCYDIHFGGIYYIYLRGMDTTNPRSGIYFHRPEADQNVDLSLA